MNGYTVPAKRRFHLRLDPLQKRSLWQTPPPAEFAVAHHRTIAKTGQGVDAGLSAPPMGLEAQPAAAACNEPRGAKRLFRKGFHHSHAPDVAAVARFRSRIKTVMRPLAAPDGAVR